MPDASTLPTITLQNVAGSGDVPDERDFRRWATRAMAVRPRRAGVLNIRIVDEPEIAQLNQRFRSKAGPTNVLSFPFEDPPGVAAGILGDVVVCAPVVAREARNEQIPTTARWAHMVVHGVLHLLGFDHQDDVQAADMEAAESRCMRQLGFPAPYPDQRDDDH